MSSEPTLRELRAEFGRNRLIAMPIAGTIAWAAAGVFGALLPVKTASFALFICVGMTFPLGIAVGRLIGEDVLRTQNELDRLFGYNIAMANLVWAIAIPFWLVYPSSLPLSIGVLAGLMWVPLSWMLQHPVGLFHALSRTVLITVAWFVFPAHRFVVIPAIIVAIYLISIVMLVRRPRPQ
ncbi:MAG: DUF7010 family protein [Candidatus Acidiferrales bacterium]